VVDGVEVRLEDPEGAPRYMIAVLRGVRVGPSPAWLGRSAHGGGPAPDQQRVDATNYILLELNQPLHAFDLAKLRGLRSWCGARGRAKRSSRSTA